MSLTTTRQDLAEALQGIGWIVYRSPKENMTPPCLVMVPAEPYATITTVGGRLQQSFRLTLCVSLNDDEASLGNLETLIESTVDSLKSIQGLAWGTFSRPGSTQVGPNELLTTDVQIDITTN